jgi:hypothetical protein
MTLQFRLQTTRKSWFTVEQQSAVRQAAIAASVVETNSTSTTCKSDVSRQNIDIYHSYSYPETFWGSHGRLLSMYIEYAKKSSTENRQNPCAWFSVFSNFHQHTKRLFCDKNQTNMCHICEKQISQHQNILLFKTARLRSSEQCMCIQYKLLMITAIRKSNGATSSQTIVFVVQKRMRDTVRCGHVVLWGCCGR